VANLNRLLLYPLDPYHSVDPIPLLELLHQRQFVEAPLPIEYGEQSYQVGDRFFDAFLFLGCSPNIELTPSTDDPQQPFCYLQLESRVTPQLLMGKNLKAACPQCKQRFSAEQKQTVDEQGAISIHCKNCGSIQPVQQIAWRKTAAYGKTGLSLWNIYEGEAVPSDQLLTLLQQQSGVQWRYSYIAG
jgi:hypothetical protein